MQSRAQRITIARAIKVVESYQPMRKLTESEKELLANIKDGIITNFHFMKASGDSDEKSL